MTRPLLSISCALVIGAYSAATLAADSGPGEQDTLVQVDAKRDQISGADKVAASTAKGPSTMLDAPIETGDAPSQVEQP